MKPFSDRLIRRLGDASAVAAFTGAGMSAESGVPTFRGEDGIWKKFNPAELANIDAFLRNPDLVWEWYSYRRSVVTSVQPNAGHFALAAMQDCYPGFCVITQNVDNLHRRAGSRIVHELHGNIERNFCIDCKRPAASREASESKGVPRCPKCGGLIRPDVVWFGELLPVPVWDASVAAAEAADLFLVVGTSGVVAPASTLPGMARRSGAYVVEINVEPSELSPFVDELIVGKAGEVLPKLLEYSPVIPTKRQDV